ncbi:hypothetical protein BAE44_0025716 [Dichanthelium oligosanthes]|uniref:Uncharacterized protein n=1 Tax=Dichanthelium oligosanthes TaxID=888268 RepID=A0A1E5UK55_9POAL|nr:hypothetical protein BAE44_0025716 [Dichanthelium oligosanthes]
MDMLYSVLTAEEMAALSNSHAATAAASAWKRITCTATAHRGGAHDRHDRRMSASVGPGKDGCGSDGAARVYLMLGHSRRPISVRIKINLMNHAAPTP